MNMKKLLLLCLCAFLMIGVTACGEDQPEPAELKTPQYETGTDAPEFAPDEVHTAEDGVMVVPPTLGTSSEKSSESDMIELAAAAVTPDSVWDQDAVATYNAFTLPERAMLDKENGSIGVLSIPALGISANVYEAEDEMEAMNRGIAHFKSTSAFDGNVGFSAHNINFDGSDGYFKDLHTLKIGDTVTYETALGQREYKVSLVKEIAEDDWSYLGRSTDNKVTMVTCISGKAAKRLVVQATQK